MTTIGWVGLALVGVAVPAALFMGPTARAYVRYMFWKKLSRRSGGEGQYASVNGVRIYYEIHGSGEDLVLLHGALGFIEWFYEQIPYFARRYRVIGLDSRAQGRSSGGEGPLSYDTMASDVAAVLDHLGVRRAAIVGWSDGAIIALKLATSRPELVGRMVLIGANFRPDGLFDEMRELIAKRTPASLDVPTRSFYKKLSPHPELLPKVLAKINHLLLTEPNFTLGELASIRCPTLVLNGENENAIKPEHAEELAYAIAEAELALVPDADHLAPMQKPRSVNAAIAQFLVNAAPQTLRAQSSSPAP